MYNFAAPVHFVHVFFKLLRLVHQRLHLGARIIEAFLRIFKPQCGLRQCLLLMYACRQCLLLMYAFRQNTSGMHQKTESNTRTCTYLQVTLRLGFIHLKLLEFGTQTLQAHLHCAQHSRRVQVSPHIVDRYLTGIQVQDCVVRVKHVVRDKCRIA